MFLGFLNSLNSNILLFKDICMSKFTYTSRVFFFSSCFLPFIYIFCRVESFIEHQDACNMGRIHNSESQPLQTPTACLSRTASSPSPSSETNFNTCPWQTRLQAMPKTTKESTIFMNPITPITTITPSSQTFSKNNKLLLHPNLELQLSTTNNTNTTLTTDTPSIRSVGTVEAIQKVNRSTQLHLSIGSSEMSHEKNESNNIRNSNSSPKESSNSNEKVQSTNNMALLRVQEQATEQLKVAMAEKAYAEEARKQARKQIEMAEQEFNNAKRIRQQAQSELDKAYGLKQHAIKQINSTMLQITCQACKQQFQHEDNSLVLSYVSSAITTEGGEVENVDGKGKTTN
jgi:hypothetical protein